MTMRDSRQSEEKNRRRRPSEEDNDNDDDRTKWQIEQKIQFVCAA